MPGWNDLSESDRMKILEYTLLTYFQGSTVPNMKQAATNAMVSKGFGATSTKTFERYILSDVLRTITLMRSDAGNAARELVAEINGSSPNLNTCARLVHRLSLVPDLNAFRKDMQKLSSKLSEPKQLDRQSVEMLIMIAKYCHLLATSTTGRSLSDAPSSDDTRGLQAIVAEILRRFPPGQYFCVALGASADPVAVGLRMFGYEVVYVPLSGIEDTAPFKMNAIMYLNNQVPKWPKDRDILVIDAFSRGTALKVMGSLIRLAYRNRNLEQPKIILLALNQPDAAHHEAQELVGDGTVKLLERDSQAQQRIFLQEYKENPSIGRLFPKTPKVPRTDAENPSPNHDALKRLVATLLQDKVKLPSQSG